jgi:hypothetical protein
MLRPAAVAVREATTVTALRRGLPNRIATAPVMLRDIESSFLSGLTPSGVR